MASAEGQAAFPRTRLALSGMFITANVQKRCSDTITAVGKEGGDPGQQVRTGSYNLNFHFYLISKIEVKQVEEATIMVSIYRGLPYAKDLRAEDLDTPANSSGEAGLLF